MPLDSERQIIELYPMLTGDEIAKKLKVGRHVIYYCLHKHGVKLNRPGIRDGNIPWNKDKKLNQEQKARINMEGLNIGHPWNKGKTGIYSEDCLKQMSKRMKLMTGEKALNWQGGISRAYKTGYNSIQYKEWRKNIFERDDYTCQDCGIHASEIGYLTAHHIKSWSEYPELRFEISNGITLCEKCHSKIDKYRARFKREVN